MNEVRQNKATKEWVIYATSRGNRPHDFQGPGNIREGQPPFDKNCPFCPGNEDMLPSLIIMETPMEGTSSWQTRVIPNKFPALMPDGDTKRIREEIYLIMPGYGHHEVVIEGPLHNRRIVQMSINEFSAIIETYHARFVRLMGDDRNKMIIIFRNHGLKAGTSMSHPHSQIIATGFVPNYIRWREDEAQRYYDEWGRCVYCDILEFERKDSRRIILENDSFVAFVPYAAEVPFEVWIVPKEHQASFGYVSESAKLDLAMALHTVLLDLAAKLKDPDYNYVINTCTQYKADEPHLHWYLQIRPRFTTIAGFEIGSGIRINPSNPEMNAAFLKERG